MKAEYRIKIKPVDVAGDLCEWSKQNIRLKATVNLEQEDGRIRQFTGFLLEVEQ